MKKRILTIVFAVILIIAVYFVVTSLVSRKDVSLTEWTVSSDGKSMTVRAEVMSSMGFIRACRATDAGSGIYLQFFNTFGGLNSRLGARRQYSFPINADSDVIYIEREDGFVPVLTKNKLTGEWERVR